MTDKIHTLPRDLLEKYFKDDPRLISALETQSEAVEAVLDPDTGSVVATESMTNATVLTLSANAVFNNEFIVSNGDGVAFDTGTGTVSIRVDDSVVRSSGAKVTFTPPGRVTLTLPAQGMLVSDTEPATLYRKTLDQPIMQNLGAYDGDAEAAAGGVPIMGVYRIGGVLRVRVT